MCWPQEKGAYILKAYLKKRQIFPSKKKKNMNYNQPLQILVVVCSAYYVVFNVLFLVCSE